MTQDTCGTCGAAMAAGHDFCGACGAPRGAATAKTLPAGSGGATASAATARDGALGRATVALAVAGLVAIAAALTVLSLVVHDANAKSSEYKVLGGRISVVGSAKVREWTGSSFRLFVPAAWPLTQSGQLKLTYRGKSTYPDIQIHRWAGPSSEVRLAVQVDRTKSNGVVPSPKQQAELRAREALNDDNYRYVDLGPVTVSGGRWAWRWEFDQSNVDKVVYFFATCRDGARAELWTVSTSGPLSTYPRADFGSILGSLTTDDAAEPRSGDCGNVVGGA